MHSTEPQNNKTILLLLDGLEWEVLDPLLKNNNTFMGRLLNNGVRGKLDNLKVSWSPIIWTSIATGQPGEVHGIKDFVKKGVSFPGSKKVWIHPIFDYFPMKGVKILKKLLGDYSPINNFSVTSEDRQAKAIWEILTDFDKSSGTINWWGTFPAEKVSGYVVSDHANYIRVRLREDNREQNILEELDLSDVAFPHELGEEIMELAKSLSNEKLREILQEVANLSDEELEETINQETYKRHSPFSIMKFSIWQDLFPFLAYKRLDPQFEPEVTLLGIGGTDAMSHHFWKYQFPDGPFPVDDENLAKFNKIIERYYLWIDSLLQDALEDKLETHNIIVISDHGFHFVEGNDPTNPYSGSHHNSPDGIFIAHGPNIVASQEEVRIKSTQIMPTLLKLHNVPMPKDLPEQPLSQILKENSDINPQDNEYTSHKENKGLRTKETSDMEDKVKDRLKALGYI